MSVRWTLCKTLDAVNNAVAELRAFPRIVCNTEGQFLGTKRGRMSLISVCPTIDAGSPNDPGLHVFLFPKTQLAQKRLVPLWTLLGQQNTMQIRLMFDARVHWTQLIHSGRVAVTRVLDLQLADVQSRFKRGEGPEQQLARLRPLCDHNDLEQRPDAYSLVHRLNSLESCAIEHGVMTDDVAQTISHLAPNSDAWGVDNVSDAMALHAATNAYLIAKLYAVFSAKHYIEEGALLKQTRRYSTLHEHSLNTVWSAPPPLLPLEILTPSNPWGPRICCRTCDRLLAPECFPRQEETHGRRDCQTCRAINNMPATATALREPVPVSRPGYPPKGPSAADRRREWWMAHPGQPRREKQWPRGRKDRASPKDEDT